MMLQGTRAAVGRGSFRHGTQGTNETWLMSHTRSGQYTDGFTKMVRPGSDARTGRRRSSQWPKAATSQLACPGGSPLCTIDAQLGLPQWSRPVDDRMSWSGRYPETPCSSPQWSRPTVGRMTLGALRIISNHPTAAMESAARRPDGGARSG
jgi:hypothetical protein